MPKPDVVMTAETKEVILEPGGKAEVSVSIAGRTDSVAGFRSRSATFRRASAYWMLDSTAF